MFQEFRTSRQAPFGFPYRSHQTSFYVSVYFCRVEGMQHGTPAVIVVYLGRIVMQMRLIAIQTLLNFGVMTDTIADTHGPSVTKNANCC